jgi:hypothetical protein
MRNSSKGGSIDKETIRLQRRGPRRERTTYNSITKICGDYSSNRGKGVNNTTPRSRIID